MQHPSDPLQELLDSILGQNMFAQQDATRVASTENSKPSTRATLVGPAARVVGFSSDDVQTLLLGSGKMPSNTPLQRKREAANFTPEILDGLIDSLQAIVGGDVKVSRNRDALLRPFSLGTANRLTQNVRVTGLGEKIDPRGTLKHEFGHIADFRNTFRIGKQSFSRNEEDFADAFMRLFSELQSSTDTTISDFMKSTDTKLEERDLLVDMLNTEIFRGHPLWREAMVEKLGRTHSDLVQDATRINRQP